MLILNGRIGDDRITVQLDLLVKMTAWCLWTITSVLHVFLNLSNILLVLETSNVLSDTYMIT